MMKTLWTLCFVPCFVFANPVQDQIENAKWDPKKTPVAEESAPNDKHSKSEWEKVATTKAPACKAGESRWKVAASSTVEAAATKEKNLAVKGKFSRFTATAVEGSGKLAGEGFLDLSSWNSGVAPRDYRVLKHVFAVEEAGQTVLPFKFTLPTWAPKQTQWVSPLILQFTFQGKPVELTFAATLKAEGKNVRITSAEPKRFTFLSEKRKGAFQKLLELCNHHFLASFADVSLDLTLEEACPH